VLLATLVLVVSFTAVVTAIVEQEEGDTAGARFAVAVAIALIPLAFTILARVSRTPQPFRRVLLASPMALAGYVALGSLIREPTSSLVIAFGVAGAFVLRLDPPHRLATRIMVVSVTGILVLLLYVMAQTVAIIAAPFLPFVVLMLADRIAALRPSA
jgi:RsiW-degrading membrane proteinase PrsW (M82 family)